MSAARARPGRIAGKVRRDDKRGKRESLRLRFAKTARMKKTHSREVRFVRRDRQSSGKLFSGRGSCMTSAIAAPARRMVGGRLSRAFAESRQALLQMLTALLGSADDAQDVLQ